MARKIRIEITVVSKAGTIKYRHARGDLRPDGKPGAGPSEADIAYAKRAILHLLKRAPATRGVPHLRGRVRGRRS